MSIFNNTYCELCESFITKDQWNKHLHASRHLQGEVNGYWPSNSPL